MSSRILGKSEALQTGPQGIGMAWSGRSWEKLGVHLVFLASSLGSIWMSLPHLGATAALGLFKVFISKPHLSFTAVELYSDPFQLSLLLFVPSKL